MHQGFRYLSWANSCKFCRLFRWRKCFASKVKMNCEARRRDICRQRTIPRSARNLTTTARQQCDEPSDTIEARIWWKPATGRLLILDLFFFGRSYPGREEVTVWPVWFRIAVCPLQIQEYILPKFLPHSRHFWWNISDFEIFPFGTGCGKKLHQIFIRSTNVQCPHQLKISFTLCCVSGSNGSALSRVMLFMSAIQFKKKLFYSVVLFANSHKEILRIRNFSNGGIHRGPFGAVVVFLKFLENRTGWFKKIISQCEEILKRKAA